MTGPFCFFTTFKSEASGGVDPAVCGGSVASAFAIASWVETERPVIMAAAPPTPPPHYQPRTYYHPLRVESPLRSTGLCRLADPPERLHRDSLSSQVCHQISHFLYLTWCTCLLFRLNPLRTVSMTLSLDAVLRLNASTLLIL